MTDPTPPAPLVHAVARSATAASWRTWREATRIVGTRRNLRSTALLALVVGTVLFAINQLDVVLDGHADGTTAVKIAMTYTVPFAVSNCGVLMATRRASVDTACDREPPG